MSSHIVYEGVSRSRDNGDDDHTLFAGQRLWFAHAIPQRAWLMQNATLNGAVVVKIDVEADVRLVDHTKKDNAPGTHSYKYVEASIRNGALEDLASHAIGAPSRVSRPVGSTLTAPKPGRTPFTPEDDQLLWNWIKPFVDKGGAGKGNEIYKQLEAVNPRHTFQSWRDRWIKHTQYQKRQITDTIEPQDPQSTAPVASPSRIAPQRKRPRELNDDGEAQRAQQDQGELPTGPVSSRRSPARGHPQTSFYTYEDAAEDALRESTREDSLPQNSRRPQVEEKTLSKSLSKESKARQIRSRASPERSSPALLATQGRDRRTPVGQSNAQPTVPSAPRSGGGKHSPPGKSKGPSSRPFTQEEYRQLYELVAANPRKHFIDFDGSWEAFAQENNSHTPFEWKSYYVSKVIPDFCVNKGLSLEQVAPYLFERSEETVPDVRKELGVQEQNQPATDATSTQEELRCANCYITGAEKWRQDAEGRILCRGCMELGKEPELVQAPLVLHGRNERGEVEGISRIRQGPAEKGSSHATLECDNLAAQSISVQQSSLTGRDKQPAATLSNDIAGLSRSGSQALSQPPRSIRSPSFRPQSPTFHAPESNISKKRSAGRITQSQSTQPSNSSNENSQNTTSSAGSQAQDRATQDLTAIMGAEQSTESNPGTTQPAVDIPDRVATSAPSFQATSKGKRKRLQDEPTVLPSQQDSSLSTDGAPAGQRSLHLSTNSDKEEGHDSAPAKFPSLTSPSGRFETQVQGPLLRLVPEIDNAEEDVETQDLQSAENDRSSPPVELELVSEGVEINADSQSTSGRDNEEMDEDVDAYFNDLVPLDKRQRSEVFETAQQTPEYYETAQEEQSQEILSDRGNTPFLPDGLAEDDDFDMTELPGPPEGFEAYGVAASVMPPDENNMREGEPIDSDDAIASKGDRVVEQEEHEQSPEIKLEDGSCLKPRDQPLLPLEYSPPTSDPEVDEPADSIEAEDGVRRAEEQRLQQKEADEESEFNKEMRIDAHRREAERFEEERVEAQRNAARQEAQLRKAEQREAQGRQTERLEAERAEAAPRERQLREAERLEAQRVETARLKTQRRAAERSKAEAPTQEPSSTTAVEDPPFPPSSSNPNLAAPFEYNAEAWLDEQLALYPKVRVLEPILFQAISATGYRDADLTTRVVTIMVENRKKHIKELRRESGKKVLSNAEIDALDHEAFLPRDMRGVWIKRDDRDLVDGDEARQDRVWAKHGRTKCGERFEYLHEHA